MTEAEQTIKNIRCYIETMLDKSDLEEINYNPEKDVHLYVLRILDMYLKLKDSIEPERTVTVDPASPNESSRSSIAVIRLNPTPEKIKKAMDRASEAVKKMVSFEKPIKSGLYIPEKAINLEEQRKSIDFVDTAFEELAIAIEKWGERQTPNKTGLYIPGVDSVSEESVSKKTEDDMDRASVLNKLKNWD